jgi:hypothetical protein
LKWPLFGMPDVIPDQKLVEKFRIPAFAEVLIKVDR